MILYNTILLKKSLIEKIMGKLNINLVIVLIAFALALVGSFYYYNHSSSEVDLQTGGDLGEKIIWDQNRQYPPDFTDAEKIVLVPQTDKVNREDHWKWDDTVVEIATEAEVDAAVRFLEALDK